MSVCLESICSEEPLRLQVMAFLVRRAQWALCLLIFAQCVFTQCGYGFQGAGTVLPPDIKTIAIPLVDNDTTDPALSLRMTEALRRRFDRYGAIRVVENADAADAVLKVTVKALSARVRGTTGSTNLARSFDLVLETSAILKRRTGQVLYENSSISADLPIAGESGLVVTSSAGFASGSIGAGSLGGLEVRELTRGQQAETVNSLVDEVSRKLYLQAVAADF